MGRLTASDTDRTQTGLTAPREKIRFVTGRLAESGLRERVARLADEHHFDFVIEVLPITVAALMTVPWVKRKLPPRDGFSRVILPGYCQGDLVELENHLQCPVEKGPADYRRLAEHFGETPRSRFEADRYDIEIIAEINHAALQEIASVTEQAAAFAEQGADIIDLGSLPNHDWLNVADYVKAIRDLDLRVSIDSLMPREIERAVAAGAELVLSVNSSNREAAVDWGCEVVVIPDDPRSWESIDSTIDYLAERKVPMRLDPILEPIGCGFAESLARYHQVRHRYPEAEMMMGIGNLTELTDADSAGINVLLLGYCQELNIHSVLTTQVINWAKTSVRECDLARRLVRHAVVEKAPPKHVEPRLVTLRDPKVQPLGSKFLEELASGIKDNNYRIFAENGELHLIGSGWHFTATDPFDLFDQLADQSPKNLDASHAFYLGFELHKALTALTLSKEYRQDESLDWGYLTREEITRHRLKRRRESDQQAPAIEPANEEQNQDDV